MKGPSIYIHILKTGLGQFPTKEKKIKSTLHTSEYSAQI